MPRNKTKEGQNQAYFVHFDKTHVLGVISNLVIVDAAIFFLLIQSVLIKGKGELMSKRRGEK